MSRRTGNPLRRPGTVRSLIPSGGEEIRRFPGIPAPVFSSGYTVESLWYAEDMSGLFLSDLHLFSRRSVGQAHWEQQQAAVAKASVIVLGGDIFDIRWSQLGSFRKTLKAAERWLEEAIRLNPKASWVYLLGNHDCHPAIQEMLQTLSERHEGFSWNPSVWQTGTSLFLHGDILDAERHPLGLHGYRESFHEETPRGPVGNLLYSAVIESRMHGVVPRFRHTRRRTCDRLIDYLKQECGESFSSVRQVYFGHTHIPMSGFQHEGLEFHNAGSGIRHLKFRPARFDAVPATLDLSMLTPSSSPEMAEPSDHSE
jgi:predicted phosphodiesterase